MSTPLVIDPHRDETCYEAAACAGRRGCRE